MKLIEYALDGKVYHLLLNGTALFNCYDRFGQEKNLLELIQGESRENYEAALWMAAEFSLQGELYRRFHGEDKGLILQPAQAAAIVQPVDIPGLKVALAETIRAGFLRQHEDAGGFDPWLAEINQKKTKGSQGRSTYSCLQKFLGSRFGKV